MNRKFGDITPIAVFTWIKTSKEFSLDVDGQRIAIRRKFRAFDGLEHVRSDGSRLQIKCGRVLRVIIDGYNVPEISNNVAFARFGMVWLAAVYAVFSIMNSGRSYNKIALFGFLLCAGLCLVCSFFFKWLRGHACDIALLLALFASAVIVFSYYQDEKSILVGLVLTILLIGSDIAYLLTARHTEKAMYALRRDRRSLVIRTSDVNTTGLQDKAT
jgi:hypothetical protein